MIDLSWQPPIVSTAFSALEYFKSVSKSSYTQLYFAGFGLKQNGLHLWNPKACALKNVVGIWMHDTIYNLKMYPVT